MGDDFKFDKVDNLKHNAPIYFDESNDNFINIILNDISKEEI